MESVAYVELFSAYQKSYLLLQLGESYYYDNEFRRQVEANLEILVSAGWTGDYTFSGDLLVNGKPWDVALQDNVELPGFLYKVLWARRPKKDFTPNLCCLLVIVRDFYAHTTQFVHRFKSEVGVCPFEESALGGYQLLEYIAPNIVPILVKVILMLPPEKQIPWIHKAAQL